MYFHLKCNDLKFLKDGFLINHLALPLLNLPKNSTLNLEAVGFSAQSIKVVDENDWIQYRPNNTSIFTRTNLIGRHISDVQTLWKNISKLLPTVIRNSVKFSQVANSGVVQLKVAGTVQLEMSSKLQKIFGLPNQTYTGTTFGLNPPDICYDKHVMFLTCKLVDQQYFTNLDMCPIIGALPVDLRDGYLIHEFSNQPTFQLNEREIRNITIGFHDESMKRMSFLNGSLYVRLRLIEG